MGSKKIDKRTYDILKEYHDDPNSAVWHHKQSNQFIAKHKDLELIAAKAGITFDTRAYIDEDDGEVCRIWYFDNSLKGPVRKRSKIQVK